MEDMMPVPSIFITDKDYPEIKDWKVGKKYTIEVRMTSRTEEQNGEVRGHFELVGESKEQTAKDTMES